MLRRIIPELAPFAKRQQTNGECYETLARGLAVLNSPVLNKGTAFTAGERSALGLTGLIPPEINTLANQVESAYSQYERLPDSLSRNIYLTALHDRNEVLFYRLFSEHLREMIPIVNDLTVGLAMVQYRHECRRPRGVYLSIDHKGSMEEAFRNLGLGPNEVDLIIGTDAEQILGIGDWGVGGIEVSIGKLAVYTAAAGINPARSIPVMLDVGTNRKSLLNDDQYVGNRHARIRGERYDEFIDSYVKTVRKLFPEALLQWVDFAPGNGRRILARHREVMCTFNDDMEGTGAITMAAVISGIRICGTPLRSQRVVVFGAGTAGIGIADQMCSAMVREGLTQAEAARLFWCVDRGGLLNTASAELQDFQAPYARPTSEGSGNLAEVIRRVKPTILIGTSTVSGGFTEAMIRNMAANTERPIIIVLSNPTGRGESSAKDLIAWTDGRALVATSCASPPVTLKGVTYVTGQINNAMLYPGLALGVIVSRATRITEGMFAAAANAVSSLVAVRQPGSSLLPHIDDLRAVSITVAVAVAQAAVADGLARTVFTDIVQQIQDAIWQPEYRPVLALQP